MNLVKAIIILAAVWAASHIIGTLMGVLLA